LLTLKGPIQLKNRTVTSTGTSFGEHIKENYEQFNASIEPEDLLHIVTGPAEVFYAEGNQTSIFNRNIKIENVNEQKIDIVNRLINRILIANQTNFTYQDRTYISSYLNKLGIKNEQRFMSRIMEMMTERETQTRQLRELSNRVDILREKIPEVMDSIVKRGEQSGSDESSGGNTLLLAENIYNRLQTDRVYDTVWNFNNISHDEQNVTNRELTLSEQKRSSTFIKLNNLAQNIVGSPVNMVHYTGNIFEETGIYEELVNAVTNVSNSETNRYEGDTTVSGEGTVSGPTFTNNTYEYNPADITYVTKRDGDTDESRDVNVLNESVTESVRNDNIYNRQDSRMDLQGNTYYSNENVTEERNVFSPADITYTSDTSLSRSLVDNSSIINEEVVRNQLVESSLYNLIEQVYESRNTSIDKGISNVIDIGDAMFMTAGNTFTRYAQNIVAPAVNREAPVTVAEPLVNQVLNYLEEQSDTTNEDIQIANDIQQMNMQNVENENRYIRVMQQLQQRIEQGAPKPVQTRDRTMRESLDALNNPTELLLRYREEGEESRQLREAEKEMYLEAYPEKVRPYLRFIDGIMNGRAEGIINAGEPQDALSLLNADIAAVEMQHVEEQAPVIEETDTVRNTYIENIVDRFKGMPRGSVVNETVNRISQVNRDINLVHKAVETINEEEILERIDELRNETRESRITNVTENDDVVTTVNRVATEEKVINETLNEHEITELVRQNVLTQMGELSDQVYSRIERRLQNEKIRRGF